jgi:hypothetical protein
MLNRAFLTVCLTLLMITGTLLGAAPAHAADKERVMLGWLESVRILPWNFRVRAKLDTGARTSAIHATDIEQYEEEGEPMVRFKLQVDHDDEDSRTITVEKPLVREVAIKLRNTDRTDERPAVRLDFCLGGRRYEGTFTLTDRGRFNYAVLIGRHFMEGRITVDPAETFTIKPDCIDKADKAS